MFRRLRAWLAVWIAPEGGPYPMITKLALEPGDIIAVFINGVMTKEERDQIRALLGTHVPGYKVLVLDGGMRLGVIKTWGQ